MRLLLLLNLAAAGPVFWPGSRQPQSSFHVSQREEEQFPNFETLGWPLGLVASLNKTNSTNSINSSIPYGLGPEESLARIATDLRNKYTEFISQNWNVDLRVLDALPLKIFSRMSPRYSSL